MKSFQQWRSRAIVLLIGGILILGYLTLSIPVSAQSPTRLNAEISSLRSRVNRLESEIRRLNKSVSSTNIAEPERSPQPSRSSPPPTVVDGQIIGRSDPIVERLAILVIELKEDLRSLDRRVTELENKK